MTNQPYSHSGEKGNKMSDEETHSNCCGAGDIYDGNLDNNEGVCAGCGEHCEMEEQ